MAGKRKWSVEEENFIIEQYHLGKKHAEVKRAMRQKFGQSRKLASTHPPDLYNVVKRLKKSGTYKFHEKSGMPKKVPDEATVDNVKSYFNEHPTLSTRDAEQELKIPQSTVCISTYNFNFDFSFF